MLRFHVAKRLLCICCNHDSAFVDADLHELPKNPLAEVCVEMLEVYPKLRDRSNHLQHVRERNRFLIRWPSIEVVCVPLDLVPCHIRNLNIPIHRALERWIMTQHNYTILRRMYIKFDDFAATLNSVAIRSHRAFGHVGVIAAMRNIFERFLPGGRQFT